MIGNLALFGLISLNVNTMIRKNRQDLVIVFTFVGVLILFGFIAGNQAASILRYAVICLTVLLAYFIRLPMKEVIRWGVFFTLIQCILLIVGEFLLMFVLPESFAIAARHFLLSTTWGDVYSYNGFFYRIQIIGSSILPFVYCLSWAVGIFRRKWLMRGIYLLAIIIAGNFAFLLGITIFHIIWLAYSIRTRLQLGNVLISGFLFVILFSVPIFNFIDTTLEKKQDVSTAVRVDQSQALFSDLNRSAFSALLGRGLGNAVDVQTQFRDYRESQYYELQILYVLNQFGYIGFTLFLLINIVFTIKYMPFKLRIVYVCYILYALTNPYIFDTTQIFVIVTLISCNTKSTDHEPDTLHPCAV